MKVMLPGPEGVPSRAWRGNLSLPTTFWLIYFFPNVLFRVISLAAFPLFLRFTSPLLKSGSQALGYLGLCIQFACPILVCVLSLGYYIFSIGAVWRSSRKYEGSKFWSIAARSYLIVGISLGVLLGGFMLLKKSGHPKMTRAEAEQFARKNALPSKEYPLAGFWKTKCSDDYGLAILPAQPGNYSIVFCGSGCFAPGTYLPDTPIKGDPMYRLVDDNTIEMNGATGWDKEIRCPGKDSSP